MSDQKTQINDDEELKELQVNADRWNAMNPSSEKPLSYWQDKLNEAKKEGYKTEVCGNCKTCFLAFHHYVRCDKNIDECPMRSSDESLLEKIMESK